MSINIYGFKDQITGIVLLLRAESREQAEALFDQYIEALNSTATTGLQVKKEIPPGTLRASGFNTFGIVNGGGSEEGINIIPFQKDKALYINAAANSYVTTPNAIGNTPLGAFTLIVNLKSNNWFPSTLVQTFISKSDPVAGDESYLFEMSLDVADPIVVTILERSTGGAVAAIDDPIISQEDEAFWFRMTFDGATTISQYQSTDSSLTAYDKVNWTLLGTQVSSTFTVNEGDNAVLVGARAETGLNSTDEFDGVIYRALLIKSTDPTATPTMDMNPNDYIEGSSWFTPLTGEVWTLNGDATVNSYEPEST